MERIASCPQIRKQELQPQELNPNSHLREQAGWLLQRTAQAAMSISAFGVLSIEVTGLNDLGLQNWGRAVTVDIRAREMVSQA